MPRWCFEILSRLRWRLPRRKPPAAQYLVAAPVEAAQELAGRPVGLVQRRIAPLRQDPGEGPRNSAAAQILVETVELAPAAGHGQHVDRLAGGGRIGGEVGG